MGLGRTQGPTELLQSFHSQASGTWVIPLIRQEGQNPPEFCPHESTAGSHPVAGHHPSPSPDCCRGDD